MKEYTLLSSARQSQNYIHCCILRSFYLPFRCYAGIYQSSCHIVYKPDWIRTLKWNGLVVRVVVSCIRSTSNHNRGPIYHERGRLFPVSVLHQTTTSSELFLLPLCCFLYPFYIKPQLLGTRWQQGLRCFLYPFYIKPQLVNKVCEGCFLYPFYIKPQLRRARRELTPVVSCIRSTSNHNSSWDATWRFSVVSCIRSTSNHNLRYVPFSLARLFPVSVLHQTTTQDRVCRLFLQLFPVSVLHQTTTDPGSANGISMLFPVSVLHQTTTSHPA